MYKNKRLAKWIIETGCAIKREIMKITQRIVGLVQKYFLKMLMMFL